MGAGNYIYFWINSLGVVEGKPYGYLVRDSKNQNFGILDPCLKKHLLITGISVNAGDFLIPKFGNGFGIEVSNEIRNIQLRENSGYIATNTAMPTDDYMV